MREIDIQPVTDGQPVNTISRRQALAGAAGLTVAAVGGPIVSPAHARTPPKGTGLHARTPKVGGRTSYPPQPYRSYDVSKVDQWQPGLIPDLIPQNPDAQTKWVQAMATDATIDGYTSVLQYAQLYQQAVNKAAPGFTGFDNKM